MNLPVAPTDVMEAMAQLSTNANWHITRRWLVQTRDKQAVEACTMGNETVLRWTQGGVQLLTAFIEAMDNAHETHQLLRKTSGEDTPRLSF